jgi:putative NADH-flavin reductase
MRSLKIAIFGASGRTGRHLLDAALRRGHDVRAVYRTATLNARSANLEIIVAGDICDEASIEAAVHGCDVICSAVGLRRADPANPWSAITSPADLNARFSAALVSVLSRSPIRPRVVVVSAAGVRESWESTNVLLRKVFESSSIAIAFRDLAIMEERLEQSDLETWAVRATTLTNARYSGVREVQRYGLFSRLSRSDLAGYMLDLGSGLRVSSSRVPMIVSR